MEQKTFVQMCTKIFKKYGFEKHNSNYYREVADDIILVFGLQKSAYGGHYYYIEYGFIFKTINKYMPYPKYHEANIRQGRVSLNGNYAIEYDTIMEDEFNNQMIAIIEEVVNVAIGGKEAIVNYSIYGKNRATLIQGYDTLPYLGVDKTDITVTPD